MTEMNVQRYVAEDTDHQQIEAWRRGKGYAAAHKIEMTLMELWCTWATSTGADDIESSGEMTDAEKLTAFHEWCVETNDDYREMFVEFCKSQGVDKL